MTSILTSQPLRTISAVAPRPRGRRKLNRWGWPIVFCVAHVPLAIAISRIEALATVHAGVTVAVGFWWALSARRSLTRVAYAGAYIAGAEVMWRMSSAAVFWELAKYSIAAIFLVAMLRSGRLKGGLVPSLYFALLLPSAVLTIQILGVDEARGAFSFNLSGPFALFVCGWFFSNVGLTVRQMQRVLLFFAAPVIGIASVAQYMIQTSEFIKFSSHSSNFATSGGFGPNQVSAILGLGALMAFLLLVIGKVPWHAKLFAILAMLALAAQSALTFSRGGLYNTIGAIALTSLFLVRDRRLRARFLPLIMIGTAVAYFVILPALDDFTGETLSARFKNTNTTNRTQLAAAQLRTWFDHPILGIGVGETRAYVNQMAHTEMTRLLAEHGAFGFLALLTLGGLALRNIKRAPNPVNRALSLAMVSWSFLFMLNAGMRIVAPAFAFGVSFLFLQPYETLARASVARPRPELERGCARVVSPRPTNACTAR